MDWTAGTDYISLLHEAQSVHVSYLQCGIYVFSYWKTSIETACCCCCYRLYPLFIFFSGNSTCKKPLTTSVGPPQPQSRDQAHQ